MSIMTHLRKVAREFSARESVRRKLTADEAAQQCVSGAQNFLGRELGAGELAALKEGAHEARE